MRRRALLLLLAPVVFFAAACPNRPPAPPQPVEPQDTERCAAGCSRLKQLGCPEGAGSEPSDPESCRKDCETVQREGLVHLNPSCWEVAETCADVDGRCR